MALPALLLPLTCFDIPYVYQQAKPVLYSFSGFVNVLPLAEYRVTGAVDGSGHTGNDILRCFSQL